MNDSAGVSPRSASSLSIRPLGAFLGAEITGVDLTRSLDSATVAVLGKAHAGHGVLVFPDQKISSENLRAFGEYFGQLSVHPFSTSAEERPELIVYDNKEGNPPAATDVWHTDETFRECPPMGTVLCSKVIPELGGDTAFANMNAIYEGLSDRMQRLLSGLEAVHDFKPFKTLFPKTPEGIAKLAESYCLFHYLHASRKRSLSKFGLSSFKMPHKPAINEALCRNKVPSL